MTLMKAETSAEKLLFTTLRIETDSGKLGTGVIVGYQWEENKTGEFLVTNRHVVEGSHSGKLSFALMETERQPLPGRSYDMVLVNNTWRWTGHPDNEIDVAVLPISAAANQIRGKGFDPYYFRIVQSAIPSDEQIRRIDAVAEVLMVGYPSGLYDHVNNLPIVRRGITATPVSVDYEAKPVFLIDASVFPGSSGSPVFFYNLSGVWRSPTGTLEYGQPYVYLLGILGSGYYRDAHLALGRKPISTDRQSEMIDLGVVYKARTIMETIEHLLKNEGETQ